MNQDLMSLDQLFDEAKLTLRKARQEEESAAKLPKRRAKDDAVNHAPAALYSDPKNWREGRFISLIHAETRTLLGNFQEMLHRSVEDCRRLVRVEGPVAVSALEEVSGNWGWQGPVQVNHADSSIEVRHVELFISLESPAVSAQATVAVSLQGVGILSVKLLTPITFGGTEGLLELPADTNILQVMTRECKINLRKELEA